MLKLQLLPLQGWSTETGFRNQPVKIIALVKGVNGPSLLGVCKLNRRILDSLIVPQKFFQKTFAKPIDILDAVWYNIGVKGTETVPQDKRKKEKEK